jgi:hypothetical protein
MKGKFLSRIALVCCLGPLVLSGYYSSDTIRYSLSPTLSLPVDSTLHFIVDFKDEIANDTLLQTRSKEGYPISYSRSIRTGVCFDNKCRPLDITLRWNLTGRYLGFELPKKEFLSKYDHEPFTKAEYLQLHAILTDSLSPLANFHYNEIVPKADSTYEKVDAVSGATSANVLEHVVEGAAFTTYKLWHLVYGPAKQQAELLTRQALTPELIQLVLDSTHPSDKIWALNHINGYFEPTSALQQSVLGYISQKDYNLAERALNSITTKDLRAGSLQNNLAAQFSGAGYSVKKLIVAKLMTAPNLDLNAAKILAKTLDSLHGELLVNVLDLFQQHKVEDSEINRWVSRLLERDNIFISKKAYSFLSGTHSSDTIVQDRLSDYRLKNNIGEKK